MRMKDLNKYQATIEDPQSEIFSYLFFCVVVGVINLNSLLILTIYCYKYKNLIFS